MRFERRMPCLRATGQLDKLAPAIPAIETNAIAAYEVQIELSRSGIGIHFFEAQAHEDGREASGAYPEEVLPGARTGPRSRMTRLPVSVCPGACVSQHSPGKLLMQFHRWAKLVLNQVYRIVIIGG